MTTGRSVFEGVVPLLKLRYIISNYIENFHESIAKIDLNQGNRFFKPNLRCYDAHVRSTFFYTTQLHAYQT